ncbi:hypothetical protein SDC9_89770 [bioreactor metagenome]|uniref:Uncharacterized protein n=1 Tax=bioreactor metagenome TaxID=1076179 RepID=A0A644ZQR4_9ZZZZ
MHSPPDTNKFHRFYPRNIADGAGFIEILNQMGFHQFSRGLCDYNAAPRSFEWCCCSYADSVGPGPESRSEKQRVCRILHQVHLGIINKLCFVNTHAVFWGNNGQRCVCLCDFAQWCMSVQRFVGKFVRRNPPCTVVARKAEFSILGNYKKTVCSAFRENIPKCNPVIINPEFNAETPFG